MEGDVRAKKPFPWEEAESGLTQAHDYYRKTEDKEFPAKWATGDNVPYM